MTAWASIDVAVEAMRRGARDFVQKPWENARLLSVLRNQIELSRALRRGAQLEAENRLLRAEGLPTLIAESAAMRPVQELIARVGPSDANVLITGEHGTGKEVVARTLHSISTRAAKPMVTVNMGGLAEGVLESELFGHVKGAFTDARADRVGRFELADGGTLFLDEIANMPMGQQARLLRVIESGEFERVGSSKTRRVNARLLSATNANPEEEVRAGRFVKTCSSASTPWRSICHRCASGGRTFRFWRTFPSPTCPSLPEARQQFRRACQGRYSPILGRATSANLITPWSAPSCSHKAKRSAPPTSACGRRTTARRASRK